jgi:hypothetical protein
MKKLLLIGLFGGLGLAAGFGARWAIKQQEPQPVRQQPVNQQPPISQPIPPTNPVQPPPFASTLLLQVPFTPQAPTANWDELHNEACEEASAIMAGAYFAGRTETKLPAEFVEAEIAKLTQWQQNNFGYYLNADAAETARMIEAVYGLNTTIIRDFTETDLKQALNENKLVVLPAAGRLLGNPNFRRPGPLYHMLVIKGYTTTAFVTNDPGTRNGLNYSYAFETLYNAAADWDHTNHTVDTAKKIAIIVSE